MIIDAQTNKLFLADCLPKKYPGFFKEFENVLHKCKIDFELLPNTKDVWAVDYMPIQIDTNKFVRFVYNPKYLQSKKYLKTISDTDGICEKIGLETLKSNILLDGGNVIRANDKVIMTERIFKDNSSKTKHGLIKELQEIFQIDRVIIIPEQPYDITGHADGMVRFLDNNTLIVNDYSLTESEKFQRTFKKAIVETGLDYVIIPYTYSYNPRNKEQARGCYINYLQMENTVIVPTFGIKEEDDIAIKQFEKLFIGKNVVAIDSNEIADHGGILNCISWNILK
jgi:agmatine deiminase